MDTNLVEIAALEIRAYMKNHPEVSLEDRLKAAMRQAQNCWITTNEDIRFSAAVGAVFLDATPEEKERLEAEIRVLKALSAVIDGIPVNMGAVLEGAHLENAVGLNNLWHEVKAESPRFLDSSVLAINRGR